MVAVVEEGDVPAALHVVEEVAQRAGAFGKFKRNQAFVFHFVAAAADHIADVDFGDFVFGQVGVGQACGGEFGRDGGTVGRACGLDAGKDVGGVVVAVAVVEFRNAAVAQGVDKFEEAAGAFGDGNGENAFVAFAQFAAFGNVAQAVEVHVGAAVDGNQGLPFAVFAGDIGFQAGQSQCAGRFGDAAGVVEDVFQRAADVVGVYQDDVVQKVAADGEGGFAHQFDRRAVGKQADVFQFQTFSSFNRTLHGAGIECFHADDFDFGAHVFDKGRNARRQPAAADGDENGINRLRMLADDFHADGALSGDNVRVVEGRDVGQAAFGHQPDGVVVGIVVGCAFQYDFATAFFNGVYFDLRGGFGHDDGGAAAQRLCRKGHALRVVARAGGNHAAFEFGRA